MRHFLAAGLLMVGGRAFAADTPPVIADPYLANYTATDLSNHADPVIASTEPPKLQGSSGNAESDVRYWWERGFRLIGHVDFYGPLANQQQALAQAVRVGARYVIQPPRYRIDERATAPANAGYELAPCDVWQRDPAADVARPPIINPYDNMILYFAEAGRERSGILGDFVSIDPAVHPGYEDGFLVAAVRHGSPAATAGFRAGDLIMSVDNANLTHTRLWTDAQTEGYGRAMPVTVFRTITVSLTLVQATDGRW